MRRSAVRPTSAATTTPATTATTTAEAAAQVLLSDANERYSCAMEREVAAEVAEKRARAA